MTLNNLEILLIFNFYLRMRLNDLGIVLILNIYLRMTLNTFGLVFVYDFEKPINFLYFSFFYLSWK